MHNAASVTLTYVKTNYVVKDGEENAQCCVRDSHLMKDVVKDGEENAQCRVRDSHLC